MLSIAFTLLGAQVTWLETAAFALAVGCVVCNLRELHWGWPLSIASSLLYGWLFADSRLYGEAALQVFFAGISVWGWLQWLRGGASGSTALRISRIGRRGLLRVIAGWALGALALGFALGRLTDSDVPWLDAIPTAGSVLGQWMLARKHLENWGVWIVVNVLSIGLFAWKHLWLTALLYALLAALAVAGLAAWRRRLVEQGLQASGEGRA